MKPRARLALLALLACAAAARAVDVPAAVDEAVEVADVRIADRAVEATLRNRSAHALRNVRLMVDLVYHWPNETHPGDVSPGTAFVHVVAGPIAPGASELVRAVPPGGYPDAPGTFEPRVKVLGFVEAP